MTPQPDPLPLDLAHLDDLRERIVQADEAIVSFVCQRVQLAREELAYRRERGLPEVDRVFEQRETIRVLELVKKNPEPLSENGGKILAHMIHHLQRLESGAVDDGRYDPATGDLGF